MFVLAYDIFSCTDSVLDFSLCVRSFDFPTFDAFGGDIHGEPFSFLFGRPHFLWARRL